MADRDPGDIVPAGGAGDADPLLWRGKWPMNDLGNARRLHALAAGRLLFCAEIGKAGDWLWFDGVRWTTHDGAGRARALALSVPDMIMDEARALRAACDDAEALRAVYGPKYTGEMALEKAAALTGWAMKSGNSDRTGGMIRQASALTDADGAFVMRERLDAFDTDPMRYHVANGVLVFRQRAAPAVGRDAPSPSAGASGASGGTQPQADRGSWYVDFVPGHRPDDRFMQVAAVAYDPAATCPAWESRLIELHDDPVARCAIQRIYGMTMTGLTSDQAFYIFQGKGGDGKSMTNEVLCALHGDYARTASPKTFLASRHDRSGSEHQADIVRLAGDIRLVVADEPKKGSTWDGERIKQVTGSRVTARAPNATEDITFTPRWQLVVECNTLPRAPSDDRAFRRRFKLFPWLKSYGVTPGLTDEAPHIVKARLMDEAAGVLNWMIAGACDWLREQEIPEPEIAAVATSSYWAETSPMGEWLHDRCDVSDPDAESESSALYADFRSYCLNERGDKEEAIVNQTVFGKALTEGQFYSARSTKTGRKVRRGIKLRDGSSRAGEPDADGWRDSDMAPGLGGDEGSGQRPFAPPFASDAPDIFGED